jgi:hypothetical protein
MSEFREMHIREDGDKPYEITIEWETRIRRQLLPIRKVVWSGDTPPTMQLVSALFEMNMACDGCPLARAHANQWIRGNAGRFPPPRHLNQSEQEFFLAALAVVKGAWVEMSTEDFAKTFTPDDDWNNALCAMRSLLEKYCGPKLWEKWPRGLHHTPPTTPP